MIQLLKEFKKLFKRISLLNDSFPLQIFENKRKTSSFILTLHSANISPNITHPPIFETKIEMQITHHHILLKLKRTQIIKTVSEAVVIYFTIINKARFKEPVAIIGSDLGSHLYHK